MDDTPKGYTTKEKIENYLLIDIDESFDDQIDEWIMEIEEYIDRMTGRNFKADAEPGDGESNAQRRYDGDGTSRLLIDDCIEVSEIKLSETSDAVAATDYVLYPKNAQALSRPVPINRIDLLGSVFPSYPPQGIYVKARWGYSENPPRDIQKVATVLVVGIINYSWRAEGEVKTETIGRYSVTYKDEKQWQDFDRVEKILNSYIKYQM